MIGKRLSLTAATLLAFGIYAAPASAQATRTWISGVGDDVNPCSRTAPCKTFAGAISKTAAGGEINCLDPGGFGAVTITKSISLICDTVENGILTSASNGININSTTAIVTLSGFDLEGFGNGGGSSTNGVNIINAAAVHIRNSKIRGYRGGYGINFQPQNASSSLFVDNVIISDSGNASTPSGGINVNPAAGFTANATITNTQLINNLGVAIRSDTSGIVGSVVNTTIDSSNISGNNAGILIKAPASTGTVKFMLTNSLISNSVLQGIVINGTPASATARVGNTTITGNATGVQIVGTAVLQSYGDNRLDGNGTDGAFSSPVIAKK